MAAVQHDNWHAGKGKTSQAEQKSGLKARQQMLELDFNQVVQIGEHTNGKPFQDYVPDEPVMGKPYEDTPFTKTLASLPINNPARNWAALNNPQQGDP
eukprot:CAMPEP_0184294766 /NCGR_PEP_ID=MMETSP1049-20130417/5873_1 /TAXON_ID=77928 /ORGANISM="Proteomonas sulcata, Strain CCMP704" /LENGTH=97 /DNA_ID=CAMNT_0026603155 /DNA_START=156 /DNA_END=449 /DNA_ORIENTATION=-